MLKSSCGTYIYVYNEITNFIVKVYHRNYKVKNHLGDLEGRTLD